MLNETEECEPKWICGDLRPAGVARRPAGDDGGMQSGSLLYVRSESLQLKRR